MTRDTDHNTPQPPAYRDDPGRNLNEKGDNKDQQQQQPPYTAPSNVAARPVEYTPLLNGVSATPFAPGHDNYQYVYCERTRNPRIRRQTCCSRLCGRFCVFLLATLAVISILSSTVMMNVIRNATHDHGHHDDEVSRDSRCHRGVPLEHELHLNLPLEADPDLLIKQGLWRHHHEQVRSSFEGVVHVLPARSTQRDSYMLEIDIKSTSKHIVDGVNIESEKSSLYLDFDNAPIEALRERHCTEIIMRLFVPSSASHTIDNLTIDTAILDIVIGDDVQLPVSDFLKLHATVGSVSASHSSKIAARRIRLESTAGSIKGTWPLADLLSAYATSGSIIIEYVPQESLKSSPYEPAQLDISSNAGSVRVTPALGPHHLADISKWPARRYLTKIATTAGVVRDSQIPLGESVFTTTAAGGLALDVLPIAFPKLTQDGRGHDHTIDEHTALSRIETKSGSGSTRFHLLSPRADDDDLLNVLNNTISDHGSATGSVDLHYPEAWTGNIKLETTTGSIHVRGENVKVIKEKKGWVGQTIEAVKKSHDGHVGSSRMESSVVAGSIRLAVTDER